MTQDKIKEILHNSIEFDEKALFNEEKSPFTIDDDKVAKEIYKLHLEAQLELIHNLNDTYYKSEEGELLDDIIHNICEELETKLKELE